MNEKNNKAPDKKYEQKQSYRCPQIRKISCVYKAKKFFNLYFKVKSNQLTTTYLMTNVWMCPFKLYIATYSTKAYLYR